MVVLHLVKTSVGAMWALRLMRELVAQGIEVHVALPCGGPCEALYREAGITTLAMLLGRRKALYLYAALCVGAYGVLLLLAAFGVLPLSGLLPFVLAPGLWRTLRTLGTRPLPESELVSLDGVSARHHFLFGLLLIAGILLPRGLELAQGLILSLIHI